MRSRREESGDAGYDSFLDVVSNMVGILIVLVMVVGIRAGKAPLPVITPTDLPPGASSSDDVFEGMAADLATADEIFAKRRQQLEWVNNENLQLVAQIAEEEQGVTVSEELRRAVAQSETELARLADERLKLVAASGAPGLAAELPTSELAVSEERRTGLERELYDLRIESQDLRRQLQTPALVGGMVLTASAQSDDPVVVLARATVTLESYPTPVRRVVSEPERHYQLRGGRLAEVPIDALVQLVMNSARSQVNKMTDRMVPFDHSTFGDNRAMQEVGDVVGPVDGFRMRYMLRRNGPVIELAQWTVVPVYGEQGERLKELFRPDSRFMRSLDGVHPDSCTLTFWVCEDSFEEFHAIRKWAHEHGWSVACRPLPDNCPISGSPDGARSEAS